MYKATCYPVGNLTQQVWTYYPAGSNSPAIMSLAIGGGQGGRYDCEVVVLRVQGRWDIMLS